MKEKEKEMKMEIEMEMEKLDDSTVRDHWIFYLFHFLFPHQIFDPNTAFRKNYNTRSRRYECKKHKQIKKIHTQEHKIYMFHQYGLHPRPLQLFCYMTFHGWWLHVVENYQNTFIKISLRLDSTLHNSHVLYWDNNILIYIYEKKILK